MSSYLVRSCITPTNELLVFLITGRNILGDTIRRGQEEAAEEEPAEEEPVEEEPAQEEPAEVDA